MTPTPSRRVFRLLIEDELTFKRGSVNLVLGPTGSGKTSMLMALLGKCASLPISASVLDSLRPGEMHYIPIGPDSYVNLPRTGGVAYAAQESWVQNETIKVCSPLLSQLHLADSLCRTTSSSVRHLTLNATIRVSGFSTLGCSTLMEIA